MKKLLFFLIFCAFFFGVSAQTPNAPWTTEGNAGTDETNFLGTTDYTPLIF